MKVKKKVLFMKRLRWIGLLFGVLMYCGTFLAFGHLIASLLGIAAGLGFYYICDSESRRTMCQHVADDLRSAVTEAGHSRCIVEIKSISTGLITRVYIIGAKGIAARYNRAVMERINRSWYKKHIWVTQIVELNHENELKEAHEYLDDALLDDLKRMRGEKWGRKGEDDKEGKR